MLRSTSGYPRAGRSHRSDLTRRSVLGVTAVLAGAGIADLLHKPSNRSTSGSGPTAVTTTANDSTAPSSGSRVPSAVTTGPSAPTSPPASHSQQPTHPSQTHQPAGHGDQPGTRGKGANARNHHDEIDRVTLPAATVRVRTRPIYYVDELVANPPKHAIALTVDDGPDPEYTPKVLRLLDKHRMQASFCVVGAHADAYPKLIRDIARAGHVIVNHSYSHIQPFNHQTEKRVVAEITRTQRSIEKAAKLTPELFRAPGGAWSPFIFKAVAAYGLTPLDWDVDPLDWEMPGTKRIVRAMLHGRPNDIVICHDGGGDRIETVRALRKVLPTWKHRGYVTVPLVVPSSVKLPTAPPSATPSSTPSSSPSASTSATTAPSQQSETSTQ
jgi:peptidoglycan-N-acetylglucosamine deacetylase